MPKHNISKKISVLFMFSGEKEKKPFHLKNTFVKDWLFSGGKEHHFNTSEYQTYDGWYNNPWNPCLGSTGRSFFKHFSN